MKIVTILILLVLLFVVAFNFFNNEKSQDSNKEIETMQNETIENILTETINDNSNEANIDYIQSTFTTELIINDYNNLISYPKELVHKLFIIQYNYNTDNGNYWNGTEELMTKECFDRFKPPSSPNDRNIESLKTIKMIYRLKDFDIYENFFTGNSIELIGIADYSVVIKNQLTIYRDFIKFKVEKNEDTWLISNIELLSTVTLEE